MMNNTPSGAKKHCESTKPESRQMAKMFFFLLLLLLQTGWFKFAWLFHMVFAQNSSISTEQCTSPSLFPGFMRRFEPLTEELWFPLWHHFFFHVYACTQITWQLNVIITQDCWIRNTVGVRGVFEESLVWSMILQPILLLLRKPVRGNLLLCNRWQTSAQACICC